ncbi:MAG: hypothetical protein ACT4NY_28885 [Pseudonocardiales bacterium]
MAEVDDVLVEILRLRGAEYVCLADRTNRHIIGEAGHDDSENFSKVVKLETMVSEFLDSEFDDDLDDLIISSRHWYHLICHVDSFGIPPLMLYLRLQRSRANLAIARRELRSAELKNRLVRILWSRDGRHDDATSIPGESNHVYFTLSLQPNPAGSVATPMHQPDLTAGGGSSPDAVLAPLPRRVPASSRAMWAGRPREPEPNEPGELPNVVRQSWASDQNTMERLVHGLRRMMP